MQATYPESIIPSSHEIPNHILAPNFGADFIPGTIKTRPKVLRGETIRKKTGCGAINVIINHDATGVVEVFLKMGKAGGCAASQGEAIGRLLSLATKYSIPMDTIVRQMIGIRCHRAHGTGDNRILSCCDAVAKAYQDYLETNTLEVSSIQISSDIFSEMPEAGACPKCGSTLSTKVGKTSCTRCEFTR